MSGLLSLMGWTFLPGMAARFIQNTYYGLTIRAGSPRPQPGQQRFAEHYRRIYILVVCAYLLFTMYEADWDLQRQGGSFYAVLGVGPDAPARDIKRRYRQLSAVMHPDKGGASYDADVYIRVQTAHETLSDDVRRFAYDRFGPAVLEWRGCTVVRDFVMRGAREMLGYYGMGALVIYVFPKLGYFQQGVYWRWVALASLFLLEVHAITRPDHPWFLTGLVNPFFTNVLNPICAFWAPAMIHPPYLPFQAIALARKLSITLSIALNQVVPYLTAETRGGRLQLRNDGGDEAARTAKSLDELEQMARGVDEDANRMVKMEVAPFAGDAQVLASLRDKMQRWLVDNTVRSDPMTRDALLRFKRRRQDAPAGAQGNGLRMRARPSQGVDGHA
ncbi:Chaperone protein DnaJ [Cytospora mali]|uniref:Chaperone protein DnaJ n=1 Tax=Cytospora mali TaxID=578113 RepID=A0A194VAN8_CYTMA|nr:Chaperone protein DnaJ [Valsa mali var. pyri (nom. inval.)]